MLLPSSHARLFVLAGALGLVVSLASPARAQDEETPEAEQAPSEEGEEKAATAEETEEKAASADEKDEPDPHKKFGHAGQPGLRIGLNGGYRMVFRYDKSPLCADYKPEEEDDPTANTVKKQQKFCGHVAPFALDFGLSFAPSDGIEPFLWARWGLQGEDKTITDRVVILGAGIRIYTMSDSAFKIFIEPGFGFELEKGGDDRARQNQLEYKTDILFHLAAGPHIDVSKNFGLYFDAGLTTGVLRAIHSTLEITAGVQVRAY